MSSAMYEQSMTNEIARHVPAGLELGLRNYWYPVLRSNQVSGDRPFGFKVLGENLAAWRDSAGRPNVVRDKCPHRGVKLSAGRVLNGDLQCAWHGLRFDGTGRCGLIPWEQHESRVHDALAVQAYPAQELAGWIWAYIGDPAKFPPPPLEDVMPEELAHPEKFAVFPFDIDVWKVNWLQALDGSDGFHAVMLHSYSQPVAGEAEAGKPLKRPSVPLADRRMEIVSTPQGLRGVAIDKEGRRIHHGHFMGGWRGERWTLPGLFTVPLSPAPNLPAYVSRYYQFAIDAEHTQTSRWAAMRADTPEERARCEQLWVDVVGPRLRHVISEDKAILETLEPLVQARAEEHLLSADRDVVAVRRMMADAWYAQLQGRRPLHKREAFAFPF